ncbi:HTH_Tnp_Tc3_2 domain-containing protein [Trichonephila clavipes]|nr:HTH_Tnp_Tc3_2 domain-containing protein [Trichonephila clavipes]
MPLSRMENTTIVKPSIIDYQYMGLRTVFTVRTPKGKRLFKIYKRDDYPPIVGRLWTREGTHAWKTGSGATRKSTRREDRWIVREALVDLTRTRSTIRADVGIAIVPQTTSRHLAEANLKSKRPFRALPLTPEHRQLRLQWCQARSMWNVTDCKRLCLVKNPGLFWGQITVYGCGGALVSGTIPPTLLYVTLPAQLV